MRTTAIAATLAGGLSSMPIAAEAGCFKPTPGYDTVATEIVRLSLANVVDNSYYWQAMTRYVLDDSNGDRELATERLAEQLRGSFHNSLPPTESFWHDLLEHSLSEVDWDRLAKELINTEIAARK